MFHEKIAELVGPEASVSPVQDGRWVQDRVLVSHPLLYTPFEVIEMGDDSYVVVCPLFNPIKGTFDAQSPHSMNLRGLTNFFLDLNRFLEAHASNLDIDPQEVN